MTSERSKRQGGEWMCAHTYIHIYIYTYRFTHVYVHIFIYIYVYIYMYMYTYTYIYMYMYTYTYIYMYLRSHFGSSTLTQQISQSPPFAIHIKSVGSCRGVPLRNGMPVLWMMQWKWIHLLEKLQGRKG